MAPGGKGKTRNAQDSVNLLTSKGHSKAKLEVRYGVEQEVEEKEGVMRHPSHVVSAALWTKSRR